LSATRYGNDPLRPQGTAERTGARPAFALQQMPARVQAAGAHAGPSRREQAASGTRLAGSFHVCCSCWKGEATLCAPRARRGAASVSRTDCEAARTGHFAGQFKRPTGNMVENGLNARCLRLWWEYKGAALVLERCSLHWQPLPGTTTRACPPGRRVLACSSGLLMTADNVLDPASSRYSPKGLRHSSSRRRPLRGRGPGAPG
jgi:hypothetical protein